MATFILDDSEKPVAHFDGQLHHYEIKVYVQDAPKDTIGVSYQLDSTYYDSLRDVLDPRDGFSETLTSYGDYPILATLKTRPLPIRVMSALSDALERNYKGTGNPAIQAALNDIRLH